jgi:hypothetical protein
MKDLFTTPELLPQALQGLFGEFEEQLTNGFTYSELAEMHHRTELLGYTFEYYLDAEPYGLRPMGVELHELDGFER